MTSDIPDPDPDRILAALFPTPTPVIEWATDHIRTQTGDEPINVSVTWLGRVTAFVSWATETGVGSLIVDNENAEHLRKLEEDGHA